MISVAVIDCRAAMRAGLAAILDPPADVEVMASTGSVHQVLHMLYATAPDVLIVQDDAPGIDAIEAARWLKTLPAAPSVLVHTDGVDPERVVAAALADAAGVIDSGTTVREQLEVVRHVGHGRSVFPAVDPDALEAVARRLSNEDQAILAARLHPAQ